MLAYVIPKLMRVLPHKVQCTSRIIYCKVCGANMEFLFAKSQFMNLSGCKLMTQLLTITLQGDSWANQGRALTPTGHSDSQIRHRAQLTLPSAVPHVEEAQLTYQQRGSAWLDIYNVFISLTRHRWCCPACLGDLSGLKVAIRVIKPLKLDDRCGSTCYKVVN